MKILFVAPYAPNQIRVRPWQLIRTLIARNHEVTLLAVWSAPEEQAALDELQAMGVRVIAQHLPTWRSLANSLGALGSTTAFQAAYSWHTGLANTLVRIIEQSGADVLHVEHLRGANYAVHVLSRSRGANGFPNGAKRKHIPVVWDSVDCISYLFEQAAQQSRSWKSRLMARLELGRTRRYEGWLVHQFDQVVVTSAQDRSHLAQLALQAAVEERTGDADMRSELSRKLHVVPNGVDLAYFTPNGATRSTAQIVFSGKMSYHANVTAAVHLVSEIMPQVWSRRPDVQVWLVGKDPAPEVRALAANGTKGRVFVTGTVPDVRTYLQKATIAVAPLLYGAGIQNKVLEAMACGAPVIASRQAVSALKGTHGGEFLIAEDAAAFAEAIITLLDNPQRRYELEQTGRAYVEQHHSWGSAAAQLEQVYRKAMQTEGVLE